MSEDNIAQTDFVEDLDDLELEDRLKDAEALSREIEQKIKMEHSIQRKEDQACNY